MGHHNAMLPERYGAVRNAAAPFPAAPPSKWRPFNNSVIFQPICFKFEYKVDHRMGNDVTMPPQRCGAVRGSAAPFPAVPPSKWCPFNNFVIFQPICFKFEYKVDCRMGNDVTMPYVAPRHHFRRRHPQSDAHSITLPFSAVLR